MRASATGAQRASKAIRRRRTGTPTLKKTKPRRLATAGLRPIPGHTAVDSGRATARGRADPAVERIDALGQLEEVGTRGNAEAAEQRTNALGDVLLDDARDARGALAQRTDVGHDLLLRRRCRALDVALERFRELLRVAAQRAGACDDALEDRFAALAHRRRRTEAGEPDRAGRGI